MEQVEGRFLRKDGGGVGWERETRMGEGEEGDMVEGCIEERLVIYKYD